jgi:acetyl esterase/lipase
MKRIALAVVMAAAVLVPAEQAPAATRYRDAIFPDVVKTADVEYGSALNSRGELEVLTLDVYQPAGDEATDRPLYIWAHGSGFTVMTVDKSSVGPIIDYTKTGWVTASINYRKRPELPTSAYPGYVEEPTALPSGVQAARDAAHDMQAAVRFMRANAERFGIDADKIAVGGMSAGGIMALMTAFNEDDPGTSGTPGVSSRVAAGIGHAASYLPVLQADPYGIRPGSPPIAIFHGLMDFEVPQFASMTPCLITRAMLNVCEFALYSDRGHQLLGTREALDFLYRMVAA